MKPLTPPEQRLADFEQALLRLQREPDSDAAKDLYRHARANVLRRGGGLFRVRPEADDEPADPVKKSYSVKAMLEAEHKEKGRPISVLYIRNFGTGIIVFYSINGAFPLSKLMRSDKRVAFMHDDGIIWDRSCRWGITT